VPQYREDDRQSVGKRNRIALAPEYAERYTREILNPFDLGAIVAERLCGSMPMTTRPAWAAQGDALHDLLAALDDARLPPPEDADRPRGPAWPGTRTRGC
jgi:hypothetical protein